MDNPDDTGDSSNNDAGDSLPQARPVALEELARALADGPDSNDDDASDADSSGDSQNNADDSGDGDSLAPPQTIAEAAERLGLDVAELYKLRVPDPHSEGDSFTLGEMQHEHEKRSQFAVDQLAWENERQEQQRKLTEAREETEELLRHLPQNALKPEALEAVKKHLENRATRERQLTVDVIPEWKNPDRATADLEQMVKFMQGQGFDARYLQTVKDHKLMRFVRNAWLLQKRVDDALAMVEKRPSNSGKPGNSGPRQPQPAAKPNRRNPNEKRQQMVDLMQPTEG